jgi:hypothetical protein
VLTTLLFCGCKKKIDFGPDEGITYRDNNNNPVSKIDPSDWTLDGNWSKQEKKLFDGLGVDVNSTAQGVVRNISLYPNPIETQGNFTYSVTASLSLKLVVVDRKYKVLLNTTYAPPTVGHYAFNIDFTDSKFESGESYRMYYVFYQGSTLYYKGHGDIKMAD